MGLTFLYSLIIVAFLLHIISAGIVMRRLGRNTKAPLDDFPSITLLRPICGLEFGLEASLRSSFELEYPSFDVIICCQNEQDPATEIARHLMNHYPNIKSQLLIGDDKISGNPKLNNLAKGWRVSTGEWVVMADSNLTLPKDYLSQIMVCRGESICMVSSPAIGVNPSNFWGSVEAGFLNTYQARWQLFGDEFGAGFAQGKTLAYPKEWLNSHGGIEALGSDLAEDVASTKLVRMNNLSVKVTTQPFAQSLGPRDAKSVINRQMRWAHLRRDGFPLIYAFEPLSTPILPLTILWFTSPIWIIPYIVLCYFAEFLLAIKGDWPHSARDIMAWITRDLLMPLIWLKGWKKQKINWRGNAVESANL